MKFFRKHLMWYCTGMHADIFWANLAADSRELSGIVIRLLS